MSTLVTGASGFVGSHVARQLVEAGHSVRVLVRHNSNLRLLEGLRAERVEGDLRDAASLERAMKGVRHVFHVAADYRLWARNPAEIYESNVGGTRRLFEVCAREGVERIVYTSTVATIAVPAHGNMLPNENSQATLDQMIGHYKRSKFLAEQEAAKAAASGLPIVIVNPTTPVGPGLNLAPVEDVAAGHLLAAARGRIGERYILGGQNMTLKEILDALSVIAGLPAPRLKLPHAIALAAGYADELFSRLMGRDPQIPVEGVKMSRHRMFVVSDKAEKELGYKPGPVEAALERAVRWYRAEGYLKARGGKTGEHPQAA
jgi:dihydroflavonol-4-reductase